jgi:ABC-2 type transport system ATP-binding protein
MKRKMAIATALLNRPPVLLLDEVTNGLDARAAREVKDLVVRLAEEGTAVFLTTHILSIPEEMADRIGLIHKGRIVAEGTMAELQELAGRPDANLEQLFLHFTGEQLEREEAGALG